MSYNLVRIHIGVGWEDVFVEIKGRWTQKRKEESKFL